MRNGDLKSFISISAMVMFNMIILLVLIGVFFKIDTTIVAGVIAFCGAIIGGAITMWGVNKTLKVQYKEKIRDTFPFKIKYLDSIIEELYILENSIAKENIGGKYRRLYENLYHARQNEKPKIDDQIFLDLIDMSIKIDGEVYKNIRKFIESYLRKFDEAILIYTKGVILYDESDFLNRPVMGLSNEAKELVDNLIQNFRLELNDLIRFLQGHKEGLEKEYFNN